VPRKPADYPAKGAAWTGLGGKALTPACTPCINHAATIFGCHPGAKAMLARPAGCIGLKCSFHTSGSCHRCAHVKCCALAAFMFS